MRLSGGVLRRAPDRDIGPYMGLFSRILHCTDISFRAVQGYRTRARVVRRLAGGSLTWRSIFNKSLHFLSSNWARLAVHPAIGVLQRTAQLIPNVGGLVVAAAALFAREPCPVWISKLVGRNTPNSLWKRIMGSSRDYGCRAEPLFFDSLVAHPCGWNAGLLARTDGATPSATVGGQLLRADYRGDKRAAAFCRNRARRHHSLRISISAVCASSRLADRWQGYSGPSLQKTQVRHHSLYRDRVFAVWDGAADPHNRRASRDHPQRRDHSSRQRYCCGLCSSTRVAW